jgi:hypothetical protein
MREPSPGGRRTLQRTYRDCKKRIERKRLATIGRSGIRYNELGHEKLDKGLTERGQAVLCRPRKVIQVKKSA